jgi:hypothetical protein
MPRNKLNKGCKWPLQKELQTTEQRDERRLQKMKSFPMLMDWQNQHSKNDYTTKKQSTCLTQFPSNPNDIHHRDWKTSHKVHLEIQKTVNSQGNSEQKGGSITIPDYKLYYRAIAIKNSMVLAQKLIRRLVEQNRWPGYESTQLCSPNLQQRCQKHTMEKR